MHVRPFVQRDLLAPWLCDRFDRAVLRHKNRFGLRPLERIADIEKGDTRSLRKDWRRFAGLSEISRPGFKGVKKLGPARKSRPSDRISERLQPLFQNTARLQKGEGARRLMAHTHHLFLRPGTDGGGC